jgi:hypothetical protein
MQVPTVILIAILLVFIPFAASFGFTTEKPNPFEPALGPLAIVLVGVLVGIGLTIAYEQATSDNDPEIYDIQIIVPSSGQFYVGQKRMVTVVASVSFGHIRGDDIGRITVEADVDGEQHHRESKYYTVKHDSRDWTETLGRWEGDIEFNFEVEATVENPATLNVKITVMGEENGLLFDKQKRVSESETFDLNILWPFGDPPLSNNITHLDPADDDTKNHTESFDQHLMIRNLSTANGEVKKATLGNKTEYNIEFAGKSSYGNNNPNVDSLISYAEITHGGAWHAEDVEYESSWDLYGTDNVRLFLETSEDWTHNGETGPSGVKNTCRWVEGTAPTLSYDTTLALPRDINDTFLLVVHSHSQAPRPASNREVIVTSGASTHPCTTDVNGYFTINQTNLGPLVSMELVSGADSILFVPKNIAPFNVSLLDQNEPVHFDTLHIREKTAFAISGNVVDEFGIALNAEIFVNNGSLETSLGLVYGPFIIQGVDLSVLGHPSTDIRVEVRPETNTCYQNSPALYPSEPTTAPIVLGPVIFPRCSTYEGNVTFKGTFKVTPYNNGFPMVYDTMLVPLPGLQIAVSGAGATSTGGNGNFQMTIPGPSQYRQVTFPNIMNITGPSGHHLKQPPVEGFSVLFGQGGNTLDLGVVVLDEVFPCEEVFLLEDNRWNVRDIELFQDAWPTNGTTEGTGRIDTGQDISSVNNPRTVLGDSCVFSFKDSEFGIMGDTYTGIGAAVYFYLSFTSGGQPGYATPNELEKDNVRWPLVDSLTICNSNKWYVFRCDTVFNEYNIPQADKWCIDISDNYFTNGDMLNFFFGAQNANGVYGEWTFWSQFTGAVPTKTEACMNPMEMQILPSNNNRQSGGTGDILFVNNYSGRESSEYFNTAFELMGISDRVDRFDKRGPSTLAAACSVYSVFVDSILIPCYRTIIWNSGDLKTGTIGDGISDPAKVDDYDVLLRFLDQHAEMAGVYISGDNVAEDWDNELTTDPDALALKDAYIPHALNVSDHVPAHGVSPFAVGEDPGIFYYNPPGIPDTIITYGGCPVINDFDQITELGDATLEMTYSGTRSATDGAVVAYNTVNSVGSSVAVVLSGFSFHSIRDDYAKGIPARAEHLRDILTYLGHIDLVPVAINPGARFTNSLAQNYPNPFNPPTTIKYSIKERAHITLKIYNVAGQLVKTLVDEVQNPRISGYTILWNGKNNAGQQISSGVYFYRLVTKDFTKTRKMVLLK